MRITRYQRVVSGFVATLQEMSGFISPMAALALYIC